MFSNSINLKRCNDKIENRKTYNVHVQFILISDLYMAFFRIADQIMLHIIREHFEKCPDFNWFQTQKQKHLKGKLENSFY